MSGIQAVEAWKMRALHYLKSMTLALIESRFSQKVLFRALSELIERVE
jgi:hypothetical protein